MLKESAGLTRMGTLVPSLQIVDTVLFILTYYMLKLKKYQRKTAMKKKAVKSLVPVCKLLMQSFIPSRFSFYARIIHR